MGIGVGSGMVGGLEALAAPGGEGDRLTERVYAEPGHAYRAPFARDRARVIHARAFRRLAGKTQVFSSRGEAAEEPSDHFRSRLTHTMEVSQIARTAAGALGLNQELTEALALVHDVGHPPFGHAGERALDACMRGHGLRFDHNLHALRIVEHFEQRYAGFAGLNLCFGTREGIIKHSREYTVAEQPQLAGYLLEKQAPLEAQLIDWADEIAYLTADLDDGMEAGLLEPAQVRAGVALYAREAEAMERRYTGASEKLIASEALKAVLNGLVGDLLEETRARVAEAGVGSLEEVRDAGRRLVGFSPPVEALRLEAKEFLYRALYGSDALKRDHAMAEGVVRALFEGWVQAPERLPAGHRARVAGLGGEEPVVRVAADYLAGMTDGFALGVWEREFG